MKRQLSTPSEVQIEAEFGSYRYHQQDATLPYRFQISSNQSSTSSFHSRNTDFSNEDTRNQDVSLSASLKRFKISTTPGELRLAKDLESLMTDHNWKIPHPANFNNFSSLQNRSQYRREHSTNVLFSPDNSASVERDLVDPLRLRINIFRYEFLLQIPRMYPHSPPVIYRITENKIYQGNYNSNSASEHPTLYPSSHCVPPPPAEKDDCDHSDFQEQAFPKIIVTNSIPPLHQNLNTYHPDSDIVVFDTWTSISTLTDLIVWLRNYPFLRDTNNALDGHSSNPTYLDRQSELKLNRFHKNQNSKLQHDTQMNLRIPSCIDSNSETKINAPILFHPNRFDVGFPKKESIDNGRDDLAMDIEG